jgi:hypothetical protein
MLDTRKEMTMAEMQEIVEDGARRFEAVEKKLDTAHRQLLALVKVFEDGNGAGMMGWLQTGRLVNELRSAAGDIGTALAKVYSVHAEGTKIAQEHNVDIPTTRDGGR